MSVALSALHTAGACQEQPLACKGPMHWTPGAQIVQYEMLGSGIGLARPVTVVADGSSHIVLYSHPGTRMVTRGIENYRSLGLSERIELRSRMLCPGAGEFREEITPDNHVLTLYTPRFLAFGNVVLVSGVAVPDLVCQFPVPDSSRASRSPASRLCTRHCRTARHVMVVEGRGRVRDSDLPRILQRDQVSSIRVEAARLVRRIESVGSPFCDGWDQWRPDQNWPIPQLPNDWFDVARMETGT